MSAKPKARSQALAKIISGHEVEAVDALLESSFWLPSLDTKGSYSRESDDTDGYIRGVNVVFGHDGDAWVQITSFNKDPNTEENVPFNESHRFRTYFGGGSSLRVRIALMILARAIQMDEADRPDR